MVDWRDAVEEVAKYAPAVATALGGPAAGGVTAGAAKMVTSALGVENSPQALIGATQDPDKRAELVRLNNEHRRELEKMRLDAEAADAAEKTTRLVETQKTMRAELSHEGWFKSGWRPAIGWLFGISLFGMVVVIGASILRQPNLISNQETTSLLIWLFGIMGTALGINVREYVKGRALEMGKEPKGFMDSVIKR